MNWCIFFVRSPMQTLPDWFNNTWVVGILGGVFSGFIVNYLSRIFLSKRENREYLQKVFSANREVIYSIRPGISEGVIPKPETVEALIVATARKYTVSRNDVFGPSEIAQELTKEVMDSSFISSQIKQEYCERLLTVVPKRTTDPLTPDQLNPIELRIVTQGRRERTVERMGVVMGVFTALMSTVFTILTFTKESTIFSRLSDTFERTSVFLPLFVAVIALVMSAAITPIMKELLELKTKAKRRGVDQAVSNDED
ncbi:hypothetical protein VA599_07505 [Chromobacterium sp. TRC.1.1.SA]|uniref:MotA/TolQ/ExbB proton channel domain-containing protein n=1 Tax=Chromobacterium indicum TaxID=3110228 RepID=A0ABV0CKN1_9NEIS